MGRLEITLELEEKDPWPSTEGRPRVLGMVYVPAHPTNLLDIVNALHDKNPEAVKAALLKILNRWATK